MYILFMQIIYKGGVSIRMTMLEAAELDVSFGCKSDRKKDHLIWRFVRIHNIVPSVHTYKSQHAPAKTANKAR
jgi:hypothetical protein